MIDDEPDFLEQCKLNWEKQGSDTTVDTTPEPKEGLEKIKENSYDAVVADYKMPEMNGLEILDKMRENNDETPFVVITGRGGEKVAQKALNRGADRYITKGRSPKSQLEEVVNAIFEKPVCN